MYPISNAVKALFEADYAKVLRITGTDRNNAAISITDDNVMAESFSIDRYCCNGEKLEIGTAVAAQMSLRLDNSSGAYDAIVFEGAELTVEIGIADWTQSSPTVSYIPCGLFTPDIQPRKLTTISLKCLDRMMRFDKKIDTTVMPTSATVENMIRFACSLCSVPFNQTLSFPNYNTRIELPENTETITYRNIIQWCAGLMGTNAYIDWEGKLRFAWFNNTTNYVSTVDNRYSSDLYENPLTITGVKIGRAHV